jgi:Leucine-rich repeat (LRR) protein
MLPDSVMSAIGFTLTTFNIQHNSINTWPTSLQHLQSLTFLSIHNNDLPVSETIRFHVALHNSTILQRLTLSNNPTGDFRATDEPSDGQINSIITKIESTNITKHPTAVTGLEKLTPLTIQSNPITSLSDDDLRNTSLAASLQELFMINCQLTSVPDAVKHLHQLKTLLLSRNHITKIKRNDFNGLTHLTALWIGHNPITYISPHAFDSLGGLSHLDLQNTRLTTIPVAIQPLQLSELSLPIPITCDCADKWLLAWMTERSRSINGHCSNTNNYVSVSDYIANVLPQCQ